MRRAAVGFDISELVKTRIKIVELLEFHQKRIRIEAETKTKMKAPASSVYAQLHSSVFCYKVLLSQLRPIVILAHELPTKRTQTEAKTEKMTALATLQLCMNW